MDFYRCMDLWGDRECGYYTRHAHAAQMAGLKSSQSHSLVAYSHAMFM